MTSRDPSRGPIAWMCHHPVAPNLIMAVCLLGGVLVWSNMQREVFPDTQEDLVEVSVAYPGASPEEVEQGIVLGVEEAVRGLDGVKEVRSEASDGTAQITIEALANADLERLGQEVKSQVDRIRTLPEDAEKPDISVVSRKRQVLQLQLYGDVNERVLREYAEQLRDRLLQDSGITQVELSGAKAYEISIEVSQENLRRYDLTLEDIADRIGAASVETPGGSVKPRSGEVMVRVKERRDYGKEFGRLPVISNTDGGEVLLEDIATIKDGFEEVDTFAFYDGKPAIGVLVYRVGSQTPIGVSQAVDRVCASFEASLPESLHLKKLDDMAEEYQGRIHLLLKNGSFGIILVLCVLGLFLEMRLAFWVMMGIPVSFLGGILFLPMFGVSLNMMSLFAFIVALGIVVDDAIVIGENVYYHHEQGKPFLQAAIDGAHEMAMPVTFSVLTNVVTFMPLIFIPGMMGKFFWMLPVVVISAFLVSLFEALFILPSHLGHRKDKTRHGLGSLLHRPQQAFGRAFTKVIHVLFRPVMNVLLHHRYLVLVAAMAFLVVVASWPLSGRMGFSLMPTIESDFGRAALELPYGSAVERTTELALRIEAGAVAAIEESGHPELLEGISVLIGSGGSHTATIMAFLADAKAREGLLTTEEFVQRWREKVGPIHGVENVTYSSDFGGPGGGEDITVELTHRSMAVLEEASADLAAQLALYPMVKDINDGFQPGKDQIDFKITPKGKSLGLTARSVARQMRSAFYGAEVVRQQRGRNELKVMVRLPKEERISEYNIEQLMVRTPSGQEVPLREVVEISRSNTYTEISRRQGRRVIQVGADVVPRRRAQEIISSLRENELPALEARYPGLDCSFEGHEAEIRDSMGGLKAGFVIAILVIFALLAIPFRSYVQPLIIMVSIPFGIIGAILGHLIMGYGLSLDSMFGVLALSGVVVNDALVLVDATNRRRRDVSTVHLAALDSVEQRFRPVMLTTLTTFCGVAPLIFETSIQAQIMIPMAISLGFGILFATCITLVLVPCLYLIVDDASRVLSGVGRFVRGDFGPEEDRPAEEA
ncbi:MAG: efflux RND transporter permease subunit [Candidatus Hydrogenedentes bacterium]|nr:efflux RND transporter permease subunit [Candidatus Hydrogenedentota bacterium]